MLKKDEGQCLLLPLCPVPTYSPSPILIHSVHQHPSPVLTSRPFPQQVAFFFLARVNKHFFFPPETTAAVFLHDPGLMASDSWAICRELCEHTPSHDHLAGSLSHLSITESHAHTCSLEVLSQTEGALGLETLTTWP